MRTWFTSLICFLVINSTSVITFAYQQNYRLDDLDVASFEKGKRISPFELSSVSFSVMYYDYKPVEKATGNKVFKKNGTLTNYTIHLEKPVYEEYISYGLNFGFNIGTKPFTASSFDTTLSLKLRYPVYFENIGDVALNISGGAGISTFLLGESGTRSGGGFQALGSEQFDAKKMELRLGSVQILSYGIDYYPVTWLGFILENQSRFYNYGKTQFKKNNETKEDLLYTKGFKYSVMNRITLGIRTTF